MHIQSNICIIGNGAIGKAAALGLSQAGLGVTLVSPDAGPHKADPASWDVRVYALNHAARHLLSSLRVWDAMDASRIAEVDAMHIRGDDERNAGSLNFNAYESRTDALAWIVEERNLNQALDLALKFAPHIRTVSGVASRLDISGANARVHLDHGDVIESALVVGADGKQSWVRGQCDIGLDYRSYGQRAIVTNFHCEKPHHGVAYQWFTSNEGIIALLPLPGNRVSLVWSAPDALASTLLDESLGRLAERLGAVAQEPLGRLTPLEPEARAAFPLALLRPHAMVAPRVALIGDAAHVIHPLAGHGMNLGFGDVSALLKIMAERESHRDAGDARLLGRYARARREDVLLMQAATDGLERLFGSRFEPLRLIRNMGLNVVNQLPFVKRQLISHALGKV